ncbi:MAG: hypothetical protein MI861_11765 [Pirellulales bacterium]|nr:hypothetical protein [Pirellulales bacterium]
MRTNQFLLLLSALSFSVWAGCNSSSESASESEPDPASESTDETTLVSFANTQCPMMGGKPSAELTADYMGQTIGFCCDGCPQKWEGLSDDEKAERFTKVDAGAESTGSDEQNPGQSDPPTNDTDEIGQSTS